MVTDIKGRQNHVGDAAEFHEITQFKEFQFVNVQRGHESDEVWRILEYRQQTGVRVHISYSDFRENPGLGAIDPRTADQRARVEIFLGIEEADGVVQKLRNLEGGTHGPDK